MRRLLRHFHHPIALFGTGLFLLAGLFHFVLLIQETASGAQNPYIDIAYFLILPTVGGLGIALAIFGLWRSRRAPKTQPQEREAPSLRSWIGVGSSLLAVAAFAIYTGLEGYRYSGSISFCGEACHQPMKPAFQSHQASTHGDILCISCHVSPGMKGTVSAKLNGTRQLWSMVRDTWEKPICAERQQIPDPAQTCESCHDPDRDKGILLKEVTTFASDGEHTERRWIRRLPLSATDESRGIHWHTRAGTKIRFVEGEDGSIPWVHVETEEGITVYRSDGLKSSEAPHGDILEMGCTDCHNRLAHRLPPPGETVDGLFESGRIPRDLPYLKRETVRLMSLATQSNKGTRETLLSGLREFYGQESPGAPLDIEPIATTLAEAFQRTHFPDSRVSWQSHPDHLSHQQSPGCFRCHDGRHLSAQGQLLRNDCRLCHTHLSQDGEDYRTVDFVHPSPLEGIHASLSCHQCHSRGRQPPASCTGCHDSVAKWTSGLSLLGLPEVSKRFDGHRDLECIDCHEDQSAIPRPYTYEGCAECHDEDMETTFQEWSHRLHELLALIDDAPGTPAHQTLNRLRGLGMLHDPDQTIAILEHLLGSNGTPR